MENKNIYKALANFQQEVPVLLRGTDGYGYKYIKLEHIITQINPILKKHNLGFTQCLDGEGNYFGLTTTVFHHPSGESIIASTTIQECDMKGMNKYQSAGAGLTYFRRYALSSMLGIITDADTDAKIYTSTPQSTPKAEPKKAEHWVLDIGDEKWDGILGYIAQNKQLGLPTIIKNLEARYKIKASVKREMSKHV